MGMCLAICVWNSDVSYNVNSLNLAKSYSTNNIGEYIKIHKCQFTSSNYTSHDHRDNSLLLMLCYQLIPAPINVLMLYIIRKGSSHFVIINSLHPQAWLAYIVKRVQIISLTNNDLFSFLLIIVATLVYNDQNEIRHDKKFKPLLVQDEMNETKATYNKDMTQILMEMLTILTFYYYISSNFQTKQLNLVKNARNMMVNEIILRHMRSLYLIYLDQGSLN